jgi:hypothetical protein
MIIKKVTYTTKDEYTEQNIANIKIFTAELEKKAGRGVNYSVCLFPDGKSFMHTGYFQTDEDEKAFNALPEVQFFLNQVKALVEAPPQLELMTLIGTSREIFY